MKDPLKIMRRIKDPLWIRRCRCHGSARIMSIMAKDWIQDKHLGYGVVCRVCVRQGPVRETPVGAAEEWNHARKNGLI